MNKILYFFLIFFKANCLLNLWGYHSLKNNEELTPFESVAHIETYEEIPIFGGKEFRDELIEKKSTLKTFLDISCDKADSAKQISKQKIKVISQTISKVGSFVGGQASSKYNALRKND